jgi:hypothetical protein
MGQGESIECWLRGICHACGSRDRRKLCQSRRAFASFANEKELAMMDRWESAGTAGDSHGWGSFPHLNSAKDGASPVVMIFARDLSEPLTRLIKRLDEATAREKERELASCAIFLSDDLRQVQKLKQLAVREKIEHTILRTYKAEEPKNYRLAKDADATIILFSDRVVKASRAFRKGELKEKDIDAVIADLAKILPPKK